MRLHQGIGTVLCGTVIALAIGVAAHAASWDDIAKAGGQSANWLNYGGDLGQERFWPSKAINTTMVPGSAYQADSNNYVADGLVKTSMSTKTNWPDGANSRARP